MIKERMITAIDDLCRRYEPQCPLNTPSGRKELAGVIQAAIMEPTQAMATAGGRQGMKQNFDTLDRDAVAIYVAMIGAMT